MIERIAIIGHGSIGKRHLRIAREFMPNADIRVLRHQPWTKIPEFADGCLKSLEEACIFNPQVAIIANPAPFHLENATALASVGCHLLVEKPIAHELKGVEGLLELVNSRKLVFQVGYNLRFLSSLKYFRDRIRSGVMGNILSARSEVGQYLPSWRPTSDYRKGVSARSELGGGVLLELSHELDYLRWIFGEVAWVTAWFGRQSALEIDVEDTAHLNLGFSPKVKASAPVVALSLDFIRHDTTRICTAIGELGSLRWNGFKGLVEEHMPGSSEWKKVYEHAHQPDDSYREQWQHFLSCVQSKQNVCVTGQDGLETLRIIEAAKKSAASKSIQIPLNFPERKTAA